MQRARSSNLYAAAAITVALAGACGGRNTESASPSRLPPSAAAEPAEESFDSPLELIPADAYLVITGASPARVAEALDWESLRAIDPIGEAAAAMQSQLGHDLLSVSELEKLGIATDQPFGLAVVPGERDAAMLYARLASAEAFTEAIEAIASRQEGGPEAALEREDRGDATVLVFASDASPEHPAGDVRTRFVLRGDHLLVVEGAELAETVATATASTSIAASSTYERASRAIGEPGQLSGYVNPAAFLARQLAGPYGPPQPMAMLLDQIGFAGLGFSAQLDGDRAGLTLALPARDDGPPPLLKNGEGVPSIVRALDREPLILVNLHLDKDAALERASRVAGPDGLRQGKAMAGQAFGVDIDRELLPLLTGELGIAWSGNAVGLYGKDAPTGPSALERFDLYVTLGVTDTDAAADIVSRIAESPLVESVVEPREGGGIAIPIPAWKTVHVKAAAGAIAATTEPAFLERMYGDGDGVDSFTTELEPEDHRELFIRAGAASLWSVAVEAIATFVLSNPIDPDVLGIGDHPPGPDTEEYRNARDQLEQVENELREVIEAAQRTQRRIAELLADYGTLTLSLRAEPELLIAEGGQFFAPGSTIGSLLARHIEASAELQRWERKAFQLTSERMQLLHQLEELRE